MQDRCNTRLYALSQLSSAAHQSGKLHQTCLYRRDQSPAEDPAASKVLRATSGEETTACGTCGRGEEASGTGGNAASDRGLYQPDPGCKGNKGKRKP